MRPFSLTLRLCRLAATGLAVTGLMGHGLVMLLLAFLVQTPAAAPVGLSGFGEICTADGLVIAATAGDETPGPGKSSGHPAGHIHVCPVCSAFAQNGAADMPHIVLPAPPLPATAGRPPVQETLPPTITGLAALSRGPPAVA